jgi:hypothetical protein
MGQIVNTAIRVYRKNFGEFVAIAAVTLPISIATAIVMAIVGDNGDVVASWVSAGATVFISLIAEAAIIRAMIDIDEGTAADFNSAFRQALPLVGRLIATALRVVILVLLMGITIVGIPFAIYYMVRWAFFTQAIVVEDASFSEATNVSAKAVRGSWWRTLGILIMLGLLAGLPSAAVAVIFSSADPAAASLASAVAGAVVLPFSAVATTLLFFDLQSRERERVSVA